MMEYRFLTKKNSKIWKLSLEVLSRFWLFEPHFRINSFRIKSALILKRNLSITESVQTQSSELPIRKSKLKLGCVPNKRPRD